MEWKLKTYNQIKEIYLHLLNYYNNQSYFTTTGLQDCGSTIQCNIVVQLN